MNEAAMKRTLARNFAYRTRAGEIGKSLRTYAKTLKGSPQVQAMLFSYADELDPPDVILSSEQSQ